MKFLPVETLEENIWAIGIDIPDFVVNTNSIYRSSYGVIGSRLLGLSFPDYLKFLAANGGELRGKQGYAGAVFKDKSKCLKICNMLNIEWEKLNRLFS